MCIVQSNNDNDNLNDQGQVRTFSIVVFTYCLVFTNKFDGNWISPASCTMKSQRNGCCCCSLCYSLIYWRHWNSWLHKNIFSLRQLQYMIWWQNPTIANIIATMHQNRKKICNNILDKLEWDADLIWILGNEKVEPVLMVLDSSWVQPLCLQQFHWRNIEWCSRSPVCCAGKLLDQRGSTFFTELGQWSRVPAIYKHTMSVTTSVNVPIICWLLYDHAYKLKTKKKTNKHKCGNQSGLLVPLPCISGACGVFGQ